MKNLPFDKLSLSEDAAFYTEKTFLNRARNNFDTGIETVIYGITSFPEVKAKIKEYFGNASFTEGKDYIVVRPKPLFEKDRYSFGDLVEVIYRLRDPDGCPWDRAQTNKSIRKNIIEEAYELVEAVDNMNTAQMREETGDVILQGILTAVIADGDGRFNINDSVSDLCAKLIGRHTHIFGSDKAVDPDEALYYWEKAKAKEKHYKSVEDKINSVPESFNALMRANKVQKIIKKTGFDFPDIQDALKKIYEEAEEFVRADGEDKEKEAGDLLFSVINILRMSDIDPEVALTGTVNRFINRFKHVIKGAEKEGKKVEELSLEEMEKYYNEAKTQE